MKHRIVTISAALGVAGLVALLGAEPASASTLGRYGRYVVTGR